MKTTIMALAGLILAIPAPIAAAENDAAGSIRLELLDKEIWTLRVHPDRIEGDRNVLRRDGDVVFGFVGSKQTRLRFEEKSVEGRLAGVQVKLTITRGAEHVEFHGAAGEGNLSAKVTGDELVLANRRIMLSMKRVPAADGSTVLRDEKGEVRLVFAGCGLDTVRERPEILLLLHQLVLRRVALFQDAQ